MTNARDLFGPEIINAYLDGELDAATADRVEAYLASDPAARERYQAYQAQNEALQRYYAPVLDEPVPDHLLATVQSPGETTNQARPRMHPLFSLAMASSLAMAIGLGAGWMLRGDLYEQEAERMAMDLFLQQATSSYSLYARDDSPWHETGAKQDREELGSWFEDRAEAEIPTPDFDDKGFEFVGGRAIPTASGSAGQMVYRDSDNKTVAIYFEINRDDQSAGGIGSGTFMKQDDLSVYYGSSDSGTARYALLGPLDEDLLSSLAESIRDIFQ